MEKGNDFSIKAIFVYGKMINFKYFHNKIPFAWLDEELEDAKFLDLEWWWVKEEDARYLLDVVCFLVLITLPVTHDWLTIVINIKN